MKYFKGTISERKLSDFTLGKLKNVKNFKERMGFVEDLIIENGHTHEFFTTYFNEYHDISPSQTGYLSEENSVCKLLEIVATYLLSSSDIESERKIEYRFWKSERDFKKSMESENVNTSSLQKNVVDERVEVIDMFVDKKNDRNQKIVEGMSIQSNDIKEIREIRDIADAIDYLKSERGITNIKKHIQSILEVVTDVDTVNRLNRIFNNTERYVAKYVKDLRDNQILIKKAIRRPIEFKNPLKDEGFDTDWSRAIDLKNDKFVKILLESLYKKDLHGDDFGLILWDLYEFLTNKVKLSNRERELVKLFAKGYKQVDIAKEWDVNKSSVSKIISRIVKKIQESGYIVE